MVSIVHERVASIAKVKANIVAAFIMPSVAHAETIAASAVSAPAGETPIVFESNAEDRVDAFSGTLQVKENHDDHSSRFMTLRYVRFPATGDAPGSPIVYLAGGPGSSGIATAKWRCFRVFMAMREFGDVIAFYQRGTGMSNDVPLCKSPSEFSNTQISI
ncbi:hypothetical protein GCM10009096_02470 [Parasphingorhabdus litoris]|uniref:Alpha/beta hydrolase n=1 Tax=Parasphingorhabdus litoris TaxID=394733 RepID=A0ABN1A1P8_9SPHN|nr:hypothetical protein [Parasphingorhabdus litoris]